MKTEEKSFYVLGHGLHVASRRISAIKVMCKPGRHKHKKRKSFLFLVLALMLVSLHPRGPRDEVREGNSHSSSKIRGSYEKGMTLFSLTQSRAFKST